MKYPGLKNIKNPETRKRALRALIIQDLHLCYLLAPHEHDCWGEHRPIVPNRGGNYCDGRYIRSPYYGDENWKLRYWRKAVTG